MIGLFPLIHFNSIHFNSMQCTAEQCSSMPFNSYESCGCHCSLRSYALMILILSLCLCVSASCVADSSAAATPRCRQPSSMSRHRLKESHITPHHAFTYSDCYHQDCTRYVLRFGKSRNAFSNHSMDSLSVTALSMRLRQCALCELPLSPAN